MTTKRELKELILSLQAEIKDLKTEVQDLKSQASKNNKIMYSLATKIDPMLLNEGTGVPLKPFFETITRCNSIYDFRKHESVSEG